jgi:DNA-directed RNA polymerase specialized sigma24 family protein
MTRPPATISTDLHRERTQVWRQALDRLSERDRLILCLRDEHHLTTARIAAMLGMPVADVDRRAARASQLMQLCRQAASTGTSRLPHYPRCLTMRHRR